ncbi:hypothetical protein QFW82_37275 [Streptomyces malaysiensis subsp. malaysiensis]|uniref:hypothetical protein n=1 Tax=Streptomyces malaysiensis TaxID=92644 RepID=UPI0024BFA154|nr:hypothetical protein [Streptomyces sp. NA07423]WHX22275.1 hypothetical protein QFW82_37275 [Streptomyces sp. NA07423]
MGVPLIPTIDNAPPHPVRPEFLVGRNADQLKPRWDTRFPLEAGEARPAHTRLSAR